MLQDAILPLKGNSSPAQSPTDSAGEPDFIDVQYTELLAAQFAELKGVYEANNWDLPKNRGKRRDLDCLVINQVVQRSVAAEGSFQTIRCPFLEGDAAFPGSQILRESHVQIAVVDRGCILGVFRPNLDEKPVQVRLAELQKQGVIDERGRVLVRGPEPLGSRSPGLSTAY